MPLPAPLSSVANSASNAAKNLGVTAAQYVGASIFAVIGVGFLVAGLYIWLATITSSMVAAIIIGAIFIVIGLLWFAILFRKAEIAREQKRKDTANAAMMATSLSLVDTGLRIASRAKGKYFLPAAAAIIGTWLFTKDK